MTDIWRMKGSKFLLVVLVLLVSGACAASMKASGASLKTAPGGRIYGAVDSKTRFSGERLFATLDSVGGTGTWMEWDVNGVRDPSVMSVLDPMLASTNKPEMIWVLTEREKPLLSVLLPKGAGEVLLFYELTSLDARPVSLKMNPVLTPDVVFRDYRQISETEFVHLDNPRLKVKVTEKVIHFTYENPDRTPLRFDPEFSKKSVVDKRSEVRDYMDYLKYEYSLMLRAFIQSTRGLFNWQAWHWYMPQWSSKGMISEMELEAILAKGFAPDRFSVFKTKTADGVQVEFLTTGNGFSELVVTKP